MGQIIIYHLPREVASYLQTILPEPRNIYYVKYIVDKVGLFSLTKGKAIEWQLTNPSGGLILGDILRQGRNLVLSTLSIPVGGLVRFNLRRKKAKIFTPNPNVLSLWSYSIQQDENRRIWSGSTARLSPLNPNARPQDNPTLARSTLQRNGGITEYWVLPRELSYPYQLKYDKLGRIWFSLNLVSGSGNHQFGVFDPSSNEAVGFTIEGIGTAGISDIAIDSANTVVWLTHRDPNAVYRFDWNTTEAIAYENPGVNGPDLNDLSAKRVPVFLSQDGHVNTIDPDRKTGARNVGISKYELIPQLTEISSHDLGITASTYSVSNSARNEPETYAGPFIRWPVPAITGGPTPSDIKSVGNKVYFTESGDALLCMLRI